MDSVYGVNRPRSSRVSHPVLSYVTATECDSVFPVADTVNEKMTINKTEKKYPPESSPT